MDELLIPNFSTHDVSSYNILVDENAIDGTYQVMSISITKEVNRIPFARIVLRDGDAAERKFEISNTDNFVPGKKIKINIGTDGNNTLAFKGIITRHAVKVKENGNSELIIECRDEAVKMTIGRHNKYYEQIKDSQLFDELIGNYGLSSDSQATTLKHKEIVQHHSTDWDFMLLRAEANGMLVNVSDGAIKISKPDTGATPVLQVNYGTSIVEFEAEIDARTQLKNVKAVSWDYSNQQLFSADTSEAQGFTQHGNISGSDIADSISPAHYELHHSGHLLEQELQDWVDGTMLRSRLAKIRGRAKVAGFAGIKTGDMLKITGISDRFNGNAYVAAVRQDVVGGSWETQIQFGLDPERYSEKHKDLSDVNASGLVSAITGLQIGKVVQLQSDPDGEFRILVKIPVIDNNAQGIWTRVASLDAGSNRGAFFMPEIDDEVVIGFINNDPRHAIMLGMLHSSAKAAPITPQDANNEKGYTTRSQMHLSFNDDTKTITIDTPAGNSITIDEQGMKIEIKDQNSNKITMDTSGIVVESPVDIQIKAGANLELSAGASLTIGGVSISVKADGNIEMSGAAAKLSAQGITQISGSLVTIN